jgi:hypothetical protein
MIKENEKLSITDSAEFWIGFMVGAVAGMTSLTIIIILLIELAK